MGNRKFRVLLSCILAALLLHSCGVSKKVQCEQMGYTIQGVNVGVDGTYLVKVSYTAPDLSQESIDLAGRYAVEGVLFKGFAASPGKFAEQYPLVRDNSVIERNAIFFEEFFSENGNYRQFINKALSDAPEIIKVRRFYEISIIVSVSKDALRQYLEEKGVLKALSDVF